MNRLTLRLSLAITALVTSLLAAGLYLLSEHHFNAMVEGRRRAAELQNRILQAALRHQMLEKRANSTLIATILQEVGSQPEVQGVMILDHEGVVRQSSRRELVGQQFSRDTETCSVCHRKAALERTRWAVLELPGGEVLRSVLPIENRPECYACHPPTERLNGILILDVSLAEFQTQLSRDRRWMAAGTAVLGFFLLVNVGFVVRRLILVRLTKLGTTARSIAAGNLRDRAEVAGDDTISALATDFNEMADAALGLLTEVKDRESQLANVINSLDDGLVVLDQEFRIVAANHAFCRRIGTHPESLYGRDCHDMMRCRLECEVTGTGCPTARCLVSGELQRATFQVPPENGDGRVEEIHASPVFDLDGNVFQVVEIWRDITERVNEEARLAELERLESLGTLASGFAHEVNTPLATTLACAEAIAGRVEDSARTGVVSPAMLQEIREIAETVRSQVLRCRGITEQFRRFSRGIPLSSEPVDLVSVVQSIVPLVRANTEAVQHVVLNLLVNAIQSFNHSGGTVTVSYRVGDDVRLCIHDDGCGITPEARRHLFEPFRTGRPHGTGLGLFLSRGIMRRFGGDVRLAESEAGAGSVFEVIFAADGGAVANHDVG